MTVPVELTSFTASINEKIVTLNWVTATEINNLGFEVERKMKNQEWTTIGFVEGSGTTTEQQIYRYDDDYSVLPYEGTVLYRLKQVDFDGTFEHSEQVAVDVTFIPNKFYVSQNYPNPFNPSTTIEYSLPVESSVKITIHNSIGEAVEVLTSELQLPGSYEVVWNAENRSSGIYFYTFELSPLDGSKVHREMKKIVFIWPF